MDEERWKDRGGDLLPESERDGVQMYYLEDDDKRRRFVAAKKFRSGSRIREKITGRYRIYL